MREDRVPLLSMRFAVRIIRLSQFLQAKHEYIISRQIGRSGTSIGANIREAQYGQSKADFISKLQVALKEANETDYWLELLLQTDYLSKEQFASLSKDCADLRITLIHSINTAKRNLNTT